MDTPVDGELVSIQHPPQNPPDAFADELFGSSLFRTIDIRHVDTGMPSAGVFDQPPTIEVSSSSSPLAFEVVDAFVWVPEETASESAEAIADFVESYSYPRFVRDSQAAILTGLNDDRPALLDESRLTDRVAANPREAMEDAMRVASDEWLSSASEPVLLSSHPNAEDATGNQPESADGEGGLTFGPYGIDIIPTDFCASDYVALIDPAAVHIAFGRPFYRMYKMNDPHSDLGTEWMVRLTIPEVFWIEAGRSTAALIKQ